MSKIDERAWNSACDENGWARNDLHKVIEAYETAKVAEQPDELWDKAFKAMYDSLDLPLIAWYKSQGCTSDDAVAQMMSHCVEISDGFRQAAPKRELINEAGSSTCKDEGGVSIHQLQPVSPIIEEQKFKLEEIIKWLGMGQPQEALQIAHEALSKIEVQPSEGK